MNIYASRFYAKLVEETFLNQTIPKFYKKYRIIYIIIILIKINAELLCINLRS